MPSKYRLKQYYPDQIYHIYNRGIDGRNIFDEEEDYVRFTSVLARYLLPLEEEKEESIYKSERPYLRKRKQEMNLFRQIELLAYCLLPDHFHLLVWQNTENAMQNLMKRSLTNYVMYYNKKYKRNGPLFENVYRAVRVDKGQQAIWMTKYIHTNPVMRQGRRFGLVETTPSTDPEYYMYSSYGSYLQKDDSVDIREIVSKEKVTKWFNELADNMGFEDYREFVSAQVKEWKDVLGDTLLE